MILEGSEQRSDLVSNISQERKPTRLVDNLPDPQNLQTLGNRIRVQIPQEPHLGCQAGELVEGGPGRGSDPACGGTVLLCLLSTFLTFPVGAEPGHPSPSKAPMGR